MMKLKKSLWKSETMEQTYSIESNLLQLVLVHLDLKSVCRLEEVSRSMRNLVLDSGEYKRRYKRLAGKKTEDISSLQCKQKLLEHHLKYFKMFAFDEKIFQTFCFRIYQQAKQSTFQFTANCKSCQMLETGQALGFPGWPCDGCNVIVNHWL